MQQVRLDVTESGKARLWTLFVPATTDASRRVDYSVNGIYRVSGLGVGANTFFALTGHGSVDVALTERTSDTFYGDFATSLDTLSATYFLDPSLFYRSSQFDTVFYDGFDTGFYSSSDTTLSTQAPSRFVQVSGACGFSPGRGEDFCGSANFKLTYIYAAVPEPSTWAMMLVGFGAIGFSTRARRKARITQAA